MRLLHCSCTVLEIISKLKTYNAPPTLLPSVSSENLSTVRQLLVVSKPSNSFLKVTKFSSNIFQQARSFRNYRTCMSCQSLPWFLYNLRSSKRCAFAKEQLKHITIKPTRIDAWWITRDSNLKYSISQKMQSSVGSDVRRGVLVLVTYQRPVFPSTCQSFGQPAMLLDWCPFAAK